MRYPVGIQTFEKIREGGYVYVDKTEWVYRLAQENVCFFSRPRRFGKSLLISTLEAYFSGRRELFAGLRMAELETEWAEYPVFRIDFAVGDFNGEGKLWTILNGRVAQWEKEYGRDELQQDLGVRFQYVLRKAHEKTGRKAVVLVDEYDKPMLDVLGTPMEQKNREVLKAFYSTFKAADADLRFVLLTGVTKFSQITVFSGFNQPKDISMDPSYDELCGITEEEIGRFFAESVRDMAAATGSTEEQVRQRLKKRYDGYHFSERMVDIYNPFSLINAFDRKKILDFWYSSGTPTYLAKLVEGRHINVERLLEREYSSQYFMDYKANAEEPLAMIYQSGYLTIKEYSEQDMTYRLDYPNDEVRQGFVTLVGNGYFTDKAEDMGIWGLDVNRMLRLGQTEGVRDSFTAFLSSIPYEANKDERALDFESHYQYTFYLIFRMLCCCTTAIEKQNSKGRADIILEYADHVYIFEFKLDGTAAEALEQIERQQYALPYEADPRRLHRIGVSVSSQSRTVEEWEER